MNSPRFRYAVAVVFVALIVLPNYLDALGALKGDADVSDAVAIPLIVVVFFATGVLVGRWWVLLLPVVAVLLTVPLGVDAGDSDGWTYAWLLIWGPMLIGVPSLALGYGLRFIGDGRFEASRPEGH